MGSSQISEFGVWMAGGSFMSVFFFRVSVLVLVAWWVFFNFFFSSVYVLIGEVPLVVRPHVTRTYNILSLHVDTLTPFSDL